MTNNTTLLLETNGSLIEDYLRAERNLATRRAMRLILAGRSLQATYVLGRSVTRQARIAGLGTIDLPIHPARQAGDL